MEITLTREDILFMLSSKGYRINIEERDSSKYVTFVGKYSLEPYKACRCYSTEFTDEEIRLDSVMNLLNWSGLRLVAALE